MSRFFRYSRVSPLELCLEDERRALRCALALMALGVAGLFGALMCPAPAGLVVGAERADFTGICVTESGVAESGDVAASTPRPPLALPPPPLAEPLPTPSLAVELLPLSLPQAEWELPEPQDAESSLMPELPTELSVQRSGEVRGTSRESSPAAQDATAAQAEFVAAEYRSAPPPPYPPSLRHRRAEGRVALRISLDAEGVPQEVELCESSGYALFDRCAREWVLAHWRFRPARRNGVAVPSVVRTQVAFVLR